MDASPVARSEVISLDDILCRNEKVGTTHCICHRILLYYRAGTFDSNILITVTWADSDQPRRLIRLCIVGVQYRRVKSKLPTTLRPLWHGGRPAPQCRLQSSVWTTGLWSAPRASGTWSDGPGRRTTLRTDEPLPTYVRSAIRG